MTKPASDPWADAVMTFLCRYARARRGHGGYPTAEERYAVSLVLDQRNELLAAMKELEAGGFLETLIGLDAGREDDEEPIAGPVVARARGAIAKVEGRRSA